MPDDDRDVAVVLGGGADHRRPPDVDVLDHLVLGSVDPGGCALERIEVHADQVDRLDLALAQGGGMLRVVPHREQRGMQVGVQRLHPPVEDLREPGQVLDRADLDPRLPQDRLGPAGGDDLDALPGEPGGEVGDRRLVGDGDQRPAHRQRLAGGLGCDLGGRRG
jgi:hypothetical protein